MKYAIVVFIVIMAFIFFKKLLMPISEPDFKLKGQLSVDKLKNSVRELANQSREIKERGSGLSLKLIKLNIVKAFKIIAEKVVNDDEVFEFEKWIYDNYYRLSERLSALKRELHKFAFLPHAKDLPRIYDFMQLIVKTCDGYVTGELLQELMDVYNNETPLSFKETMAVKAALEYATLEYVAIFCSKAIQINKMTNRAKKDAKQEKVDLSLLRYNSYVYAFQAGSENKIRQKLSTFCLDNGLDINTRIDNFNIMTAHYSGQMTAAITTLNDIAKVCTEDYILGLCENAKLLSYSVGDEFNNVTLTTKYNYLFNIYKMAKKRKTSELLVTREIIQSARSANKDISFYILPPPKSKKAAYIYMSVNIILTILLASVFSLIFMKYYAVVFILSLPIFFALSGIIIGEVSKNTVSRRQLPSYDIKHRDGNLIQTLIAVPRLIASALEVESAFINIETILYANKNNIFSYCLLFDLMSSSEETNSEEDNLLIERCKEAYENFEHKDRLLVIIRKRKKVENQEKYQGWEKKRGAIIELNKYLLDGNSEDFQLILGSRRDEKYVITLDSDTLTNSCYELVELMEHPYNVGINIISVNMRSNAEQDDSTLFSQIFSGAVGLDGYTNYLAQAENDLFACGNYTGKGIYRIQGFQNLLENAFTDNCLLSHDYIEGAFATCQNSNETALDSFPTNFSQYLKRQLRWLRGDWQLLPFLGVNVKQRNGNKTHNTISPINKWHISANIINSLVPISSLLLLVASFFMGSPAKICYIAFLLPMIYIAQSIGSSIKYGNFSFILELFRQAFFIMCLPVYAISYLFSIVITLVRLIKKTNLLEWDVFAHTSGKSSFAPNLIVSIAFIAATILYGLSSFFYILAGVFLLGIIANFILSKKSKIKCYKSESLDNSLKEIFYPTYKFFTDQLTEVTNFLPSDNFQEEAELGFVMRTSPTNIGYALISHVCALVLEEITKEQFNENCDKILSSVEKLPKWKGNLFNWYDIENLKPLKPAYVSSVDSGNFLASLSIIMCYAEEPLKNRIKKLIDNTKIEALFDENRGLFKIGFNHDTGLFDENHYDLLGSEAQLTYLIAVSYGKVGRSAFNNLSRQNVRYGKNKQFYSWTGGMFEYLMCPLFFKYRRETIFYHSSKSAVNSQIKYARQNKFAAWGISESQYEKFDNNGFYQYKAFGVPDIALSNIADSTIISPYASLLALEYSPMEVEKNIDIMRSMGMVGRYGFYESFDVKKNVKMKSYMSHHQGMILLSLVNRLSGDDIRKTLQKQGNIRAAELLLTKVESLNAKTKIIAPKARQQIKYKAHISNERHRIPYVNLLTNGKYSVVNDENGNGYSCYDSNFITRYNKRSDGAKIFAEIDGQKFDLLKGEFKANFYNTVYSSENENFYSNVEIVVLPNTTGEVRIVEFFNISEQEKKIKFSTYNEVVLTRRASDLAHPAFSDMFIKAEFNEFTDALILSRKNVERPLYYSHYILPHSSLENLKLNYTASKHNYFNKGDRRNDFGDMLDPIASAMFEITMPPKSKISFSAFSLVSYNLDDMQNTVRLSKVAGFVERIKGNNFALSQSQSINLHTKKIASQLMFSSSRKSERLNYGFFTNSEIVTTYIEIHNESGIERLKTRLNQLKKLYSFEIVFNLIILYSEKHNYYLHLTEQINSLLDETSYRKAINKESTLNLVNSNNNENLARSIRTSCISIDVIDFSVIDKNEQLPPIKNPFKNAPIQDIIFDTKLGLGGFLEDGSYAVDLSESDTPSPYSNIIANPNFGALITESGGGFTFEENSQQNKFTTWNSDSVNNTLSEFIALGENGNIWSITKQPLPKKCQYQAVHSFGYSEFRNNYNGLLSTQKVYISKDSNIKFYDVNLKNIMAQTREIAVMFCLEPVLGENLVKTNASLDITLSENVITVVNRMSNKTFYIGCSQRIRSYSTYKEAITNKNGEITRYENLKNEGSETFISLSIKINVPRQSEKRVIFSIGTAQEVIYEDCDYILNRAIFYYSNLSNVRIDSLSNGSDEIFAQKHLSKWLPYQVLCSRFFARSGFYQNGGAIGFRDRLQDCLAVLYIDPKLARENILISAAHQFEAGDVQHWWHPPQTGVRTDISDDRLFLPYITAEYIEFTKDYEIISERIPFLENVKMNAGQKSAYASPRSTSRSSSLLEHCIKAINVSLDFGKNDLIKMRGGDWNDAMDKVGERGEGTSVFTSMLLYYVIKRFLPFINNLDDRGKLVETCLDLEKAIDKAFDGEWFLRAYTDDGQKVGSADSSECKIDLLTQSWATLSGACDEEKCETAIYSAYQKLVDKENGIIKLLDPPFKEMQNIGYIADYPCGVRENGGQYTHAAIWFIIALIKRGDIEKAWEMFNMISPANHCKTEDDAIHYGIEPYVIAADIYAGEFAGRGGWSYYTGSASWYYKCLIENFIGLKVSGKSFSVNPNLPKTLTKIELTLNTQFGNIKIVIDNSNLLGEWRAQMGKIVYSANDIAICEHTANKKIVIKRIK